MTTKSEPGDPAKQSGVTIVLDADALARAGETSAVTASAPTGATTSLAQPSAESGAPARSINAAVEASAVATRQTSSLPSHMLPGGGADDPGATTQLPIPEAGEAITAEPLDEEILDEVDPEWSVADQPTVQFIPPAPTPRKTDRPAFLETGEQAVWPPRPSPASTPALGTASPAAALGASPTAAPEVHDAPRPYSATRPRTLGQVQPAPIPRPAALDPTRGGRLDSPTGRRPLGNTAAAYSDPRLRRLVELRLQRDARSDGVRGPTDNVPVGQMVRQWWSDLLPGLSQALDHMHEARASGVYPLPAHEPTATGRLGDAFGRLTTAARDLGGRAQAAAVPALSRLHERAEQAAQAIVDRIEGPQARQQGPLLGPGRLAVFFEQGVSVGEAQQLLVVSRARPMRLIPRRHGFLALVPPGQEPSVGEQLRQHPYVRDVVYIEYDDDGQPLPPR